MDSYFQLLGVTPSLVLDAETLKSRYLERAAELKGPENEAEAQSLHHAYQILGAIPSRLKYLLQECFQTSLVPMQEVPEDLGDRFMEVGACLHATDAMLKQKPPSDAPELLQVVFLSKALNERKTCESLRSALEDDLQHLEGLLSRHQVSWESHRQEEGSIPRSLVGELTELYHRFTFLARWKRQLSDSILELMI